MKHARLEVTLELLATVLGLQGGVTVIGASSGPGRGIVTLMLEGDGLPVDEPLPGEEIPLLTGRGKRTEEGTVMTLEAPDASQA